MARDIHPKLSVIEVKCSGCGTDFQVSSTIKGSSLDIEVCNSCHPAYTGKRRAATTGRVEAFNTKYAGFEKLTNLNNDSE